MTSMRRAQRTARSTAARRCRREEATVGTPRPRREGPHPEGLWTLATLAASGLMASPLWVFERVA
jgi:hypothetical protein